MQQQTIENIANSAEKGGSVFAVFSGSLAFLNENAAAVGAFCALAGLLVAVAGLLVNWHYQKKRTDLMK
jgi:hypothetical protein